MTENPLDAPGPWDEDIDKILDHNTRGRPASRELLIEAWQYGYTTGMADAAKFEDVMREKRDKREKP